MTIAQINGIDLYYEDHGQGEPFVLVHEFAGSTKSWKAQIEAFRQTHRVMVYNCRGYPPSSVPEGTESYSQDISVEDLNGFLDHLQIDSAVIGGLSMGGSIALNFAIRHPNKVKALILAAAGSGSDDKIRFARDFEIIAKSIDQEGPAAVGDRYLRGPTRLPLERKNPKAWRTLRDEFALQSPRGLVNTILGAIITRPTFYELETSLRSLNIPTLILAGEEDAPVVGPSRFLSTTMPRAALRIFPGAGHTLNLEEPEAFNSAILEFLRKMDYSM